jgi:hypothetical protein
MSVILFEFKVRDWGPLVAVIPGVCGMVYAFIADFFPPGGDTPMTEEHIEKLGMRATPRNRAIVFMLSLLITAFAVWRMFHP